jgi:hypothetical protein
MENEKVLSGNKLIAEFCGYEFVKGGDGIYDDHYDVKLDGQSRWQDSKYSVDRFLKDGLSYHCDWNKLMAVVEKIENERAVSIVTNNWDNDGPYRCGIYWCYDLETNNTRQRIVDQAGANKIEVIWLAVIAYIEWHNAEVAKSEERRTMQFFNNREQRNIDGY